jgi:hypothetical protein
MVYRVIRFIQVLGQQVDAHLQLRRPFCCEGERRDSVVGICSFRLAYRAFPPCSLVVQSVDSSPEAKFHA